MNTGIGDAVNLAWKLAAVLNRRANPSLLESYEPERIAFARRLVATTDRAFTAVTSSGAIARVVRLRLVPLLFPAPVQIQDGATSRVSYRFADSCELPPKQLEPGARRSPSRWRPSALGRGRLERQGQLRAACFAGLQVHVYGDSRSGIQALCGARRLPLHVFAWRPEMGLAGLRRNAVYLLRPDGYLAVVDPGGSPAAIARYLDSHEIAPAR